MEGTKTMRLRLMVGLAVIFLGFVIQIGCIEEPGRVRAKREQLIGAYETKMDGGIERLELKSDGTYIQEFSSSLKSFRNEGKWTCENYLFYTEVLLNGAVQYGDPITGERTVGIQNCIVHNRSGKLALALNEVADFYYERIH
jgi:hypothetical protein